MSKHFACINESNCRLNIHTRIKSCCFHLAVPYGHKTEILMVKSNTENKMFYFKTTGIVEQLIHYSD